MGKASKWFKALLGFKKNNDSILSSKNKWSDVKSYRDTDHNYYDVSMLVHRKIDVEVDPTYCVDVHSNVVSTSSVRIVKIWNGEERAAIVIQSYFRAYLVVVFVITTMMTTLMMSHTTIIVCMQRRIQDSESSGAK
ncbi:putative serine racemase-like [Capsicum annuum]|nr:putative serine racemase-like [Capsicum annuum]